MFESVFFDRAALALVISILLLAAASDVRSFRIPNIYCVALFALYPVHVLFSPVAVNLTGGVIVLICAAGCGIALYALNNMGGGDVKLIAACALWAGPDLLPEFILVMSITGAFMGLFLQSSHRYSIALALDSRGYSRAKETLLSVKLPYGLAIASGGIVVALRLAATTY